MTSHLCLRLREKKKDDERFDDVVDDLSDENASSFFLLFCPWCQREDEDSFFP